MKTGRRGCRVKTAFFALLTDKRLLLLILLEKICGIVYNIYCIIMKAGAV